MHERLAAISERRNATQSGSQGRVSEFDEYLSEEFMRICSGQCFVQSFCNSEIVAQRAKHQPI